jgi:Mpv17 / PMP22 family
MSFNSHDKSQSCLVLCMTRNILSSPLLSSSRCWWSLGRGHIVSLSLGSWRRGSWINVQSHRRQIGTMSLLGATIRSRTHPPPYPMMLQRTVNKPSPFSTQKSGGHVTYAELLQTHPIMTKAATSGLIAWSGDTVCQLLLEEKSVHHYDAWRSARFGFLGVALVGPVCHHWYGFLARIIPSLEAPAVAKRVFLDQFVFAPVFLNCFCTALWFLEGRRFDYSIATYLQQIKETLPAVILTNWSIWIPTMALNFRYVPVQYQVLASNVIATVWNVYLSFKTNEKKARKN